MTSERKRGRPPVLRECTTCHNQKPSMAFKSPRHDVCLVCMTGVQPSGAGVAARRDDRAYMDEMRAQNPLPVHQGIQTVVTDMIAMKAVTNFLTSVVTPLQRCECCWETRHVRRDSYAGAHVLCARCEYQVHERGCCRLHNSHVFYPELADGRPLAAADEPLEITMLFTTIVPKREAADEGEIIEPDI